MATDAPSAPWPFAFLSGLVGRTPRIGGEVNRQVRAVEHACSSKGPFHGLSDALSITYAFVVDWRHACNYPGMFGTPRRAQLRRVQT
jgi:hypothetical protein